MPLVAGAVLLNRATLALLIIGVPGLPKPMKTALSSTCFFVLYGVLQQGQGMLVGTKCL